uniref:Uncharacterized protein n=1 Tax=Oryza sativa subsp. japonica TaxID=39947 RepID=Q5VPH0_ORYSJ|nr:hypothetical protein [Oryza sativa Japonica Group]BAD68655.1 hypothetical protein [Oryza sativa Japonica Group]
MVRCSSFSSLNPSPSSSSGAAGEEAEGEVARARLLSRRPPPARAPLLSSLRPTPARAAPLLPPGGAHGRCPHAASFPAATGEMKRGEMGSEKEEEEGSEDDMWGPRGSHHF